MSGRGRKQQNRGKSHRSQPPSKKGAGSSRSATAGAGSSATSTTGAGSARQQHPVRATAGSRPERTDPVAGGRSRPAPRAAAPGRTASRQPRDGRRRRQRLTVVIGAVALGGAAIGGVIAGMAGGETPPAQEAGEASGSAVTSSAAPVKPTASASPSAVPAMTMSCPTGGGASTLFGHEIAVPEPYTVTITYGDGDEYTNDSDQLGAIFSHTYTEPGSYEVNAVLTDPTGTTASAGCTYTWGP
ncbi:PKD domain-containing protein [Blastococcus sp. CT_GayMR16]|uniref:PKD domain-containing protein n=1 Tax=Blastococcus sp. CT_GayMR16 TaxID=2559607 RepID=UPI0010744724|nr:PKD domain-containing protein [Blastococcus sp. CT_GayMR16]TFV86443.1 hypothetical protein E4P38_16990 [Blastococcus sp. CT_GayMR16]